MTRAQYQVLVIPFRKKAGGREFAVFKRSDEGFWQFIAGGGEDDEFPVETAKREGLEEAAIPRTAAYYPLKTSCSIPVNCFPAHREWPRDLYVIPEHCFAADVSGCDLAISGEHSEWCWKDYEGCVSLLKFDSNRNALWELTQRMANDDLPQPV